MSFPIRKSRTVLAATLAAVVLAGSGCSVLHRTTSIFHRHNSDYQRSQENRPLEVPPDLDTPATDPSMQIPDARPAGSPAAGDANGVSLSAGALNADPGFTLVDTTAGAWERLGKALDRIDGVTVSQRAQLIGSFEVQYKGQTLLLRVTASGQQAVRVDAFGGNGSPARTPEAVELLGLLRGRLG